MPTIFRALDAVIKLVKIISDSSENFILFSVILEIESRLLNSKKLMILCLLFVK